ncbi:DUF3034 family protein [Granulosicoccus antarcticus]|uniref:DUF3034 domain-containing protein n=1 Tax=Granulosicoccus antarcticus IMCC3135 TaxID=1192854 RepID=A0A2Z2NLN1_9GAMM|nr:DUF3034 family protein [Granulosicoccus antarcticus]ASJ71455.1 hypothetical protein IMCC3135_06740 [Granulosicoccus antarcticus IMCC3135]
MIRPIIRTILLCLIPIVSTTQAMAAPGARLIATGGAMSVEGAAGGGIVPWALLAGYGENRQFGATAWYTQVRPTDFTLRAYGAAVSLNNSIELSIGKQQFDIDKVIPGEELEQTIIGGKIRLAGELVYSALPQITLGLQYKKNDTYTIPDAVGARQDSALDMYLAASKLWLNGPFNRSLFLNTTLRASRANQMGLLGFGGDQGNQLELLGEVSTGLFITRQWVIGMEYRQKPDKLSFAREDDWYDVFVGWFPTKRLSLVAAWSDLGSIAGLDDQKGLYLSLQLSQ